MMKDEKSKKLYFVGYAPNGYRLRNPEKKKIIIKQKMWSKYRKKWKLKN